jgi:hypothetical protein
MITSIGYCYHAASRTKATGPDNVRAGLNEDLV